ncbi:hypothetical protein BDF21DRAFT_341427, partial [Thamnidium elegans]
YNLFVKRFEELCIEKSPGNILNDDNFVYPIRKEVGINLTKTESHFNDVFEGFRSGIENHLSSEDDIPRENNKNKKKRKTRGKNREKDIDISDFRILKSVNIENNKDK